MTSDEQARLKDILHAIGQTYQSLEEPNFRFAQAALDSDQWREVIAELRAHAELEEITDLNNDVSRVLILRETGQEIGMLQLSFIGPYGVFFRFGEQARETVCISGEQDARVEVERWIVGVCQRAGVKLLGKAVLSVPVPLRLFDTEPEDVRVYQALFTDRQYIPGEYEEAETMPGVNDG